MTFSESLTIIMVEWVAFCSEWVKNNKVVKKIIALPIINLVRRRHPRKHEAKPESETRAKPESVARAKPESKAWAKPKSEARTKLKSEARAKPEIEARRSRRAKPEQSRSKARAGLRICYSVDSV